MMVQPRVDIEALRPPPRAPLSDKDRMAMTRERPPNPTNQQPFSRGNTRQPEEAAPPSTSPPPGAPTPPPQSAGNNGDRDSRPREAQAGYVVPDRGAGRSGPPSDSTIAVAHPAGHAACSGRRARQSVPLRRAERRAAREPERRRPVRAVVPVRHEGRGLRRVAPRVQGAGDAQLDDPAGRVLPPWARVVDADHQPHRRDHASSR